MPSVVKSMEKMAGFHILVTINSELTFDGQVASAVKMFIPI